MTVPARTDLGYRPTIGATLRRAADLWPERDLVVVGDRRLTFRRAEEASRALAGRLLAAGVGKGTRVGIFDTYSVEWVVAWLAATRIGALAMPCSSTSRPAELRTLLRLGDVAVLLCPARLLGRDVAAALVEAAPGLEAEHDGPLLLTELPYLRAVWMWGDDLPPWATPVAMTDADPGAPPRHDALVEAAEAEVVPADLAQVTYTSGSSALPKGVVHTHGAVIRTTAPLADVLVASTRSDLPLRALCGFPFFWIGGTLVLGGALQAGFTLCCLERFTSSAALAMVEREHCTVVLAWPSLIQSMKADPSFGTHDLSSAPILTEPGPSDAALRGTPVPGIPAHRGMSETVGNWNGVEAKVVDPTTGEALPDLAEGELWIRGFGVLQSYYKQEREDTFDADGWLHTGDRCFMADGRAWFVGRFHEMIKAGGANVSPREVELCIEGWPEVEHAVVFGAPDPERGEAVVAAVVLRPGAQLDAATLRARAADELSAYKVPSRVELLAHGDEIPWLASGKPDKRALRARLLGEG